MTQCCKTCHWLDAPLNAAGRRVVRANRGYECQAWIHPPKLPDSMTQADGFCWPPIKRRMLGAEGTECPTYRKRTST